MRSVYELPKDFSVSNDNRSVYELPKDFSVSNDDDEVELSDNDEVDELSDNDLQAHWVHASPTRGNMSYVPACITLDAYLSSIE